MKRNRTLSTVAVMALVVGFITATPSIALANEGSLDHETECGDITPIDDEHYYDEEYHYYDEEYHYYDFVAGEQRLIPLDGVPDSTFILPQDDFQPVPIQVIPIDDCEFDGPLIDCDLAPSEEAYIDCLEGVGNECSFLPLDANASQLGIRVGDEYFDCGFGEPVFPCDFAPSEEAYIDCLEGVDNGCSFSPIRVESNSLGVQIGDVYYECEIVDDFESCEVLNEYSPEELEEYYDDDEIEEYLNECFIVDECLTDTIGLPTNESINLRSNELGIAVGDVYFDCGFGDPISECETIPVFEDFIACLEGEEAECIFVPELDVTDDELVVIQPLPFDDVVCEISDEEPADDESVDEGAEEDVVEEEIIEEEPLEDEVIEEVPVEEEVIEEVPVVDEIVEDETVVIEEEPVLEPQIHTVAAGDTLADIAVRYEVTLAAVLAVNAEITNPDLIVVGQEIVIPTADTVVADTNDAVGSNGVVTVAPGQTLGGIAAANGVTIGQLLAANPQITNPDLIVVGQQIVIPEAGAPEEIPESLAFADGYVVRLGDTLSAIALDNGTTVEELLELNPQITNPDLIIAGSTLVLAS